MHLSLKYDGTAQSGKVEQNIPVPDNSVDQASQEVRFEDGARLLRQRGLGFLWSVDHIQWDSAPFEDMLPESTKDKKRYTVTVASRVSLYYFTSILSLGPLCCVPSMDLEM